MKTFIFVALSMILSTSAKLSDQEENQLFGNYLRDFKIRMRRFDDVEFRKQVFLKNFYTVEEHNAQNSTFKLGINGFSHLTDAEWQQQKTGYIHRPVARTSKVSSEFVGNINENIDWRSHAGVVQPVQNQGSCGSCWAFAAIGALEGQMMLASKRSGKLSEQEILDCVPNRGCNGGWDTDAYDHVRRNEGVTSSAQNFYVGYIRTCDLRTPRVFGSVITSWRQASGSEQEIMKLLQQGPLFVVFHVSSDFQLYRSGIYQDTRNLCTGKFINHAVLLVGAGTENGQQFWIMKNSWGTRWGEGGYFRMLRNLNMCGIGSYASYPVVQPV